MHLCLHKYRPISQHYHHYCAQKIMLEIPTQLAAPLSLKVLLELWHMVLSPQLLQTLPHCLFHLLIRVRRGTGRSLASLVHDIGKALHDFLA